MVRSDFFKYNRPVRLENGDVMAILCTDGIYPVVGDYVYYDVRFDDMIIFRPEKYPRRLTLCE